MRLSGQAGVRVLHHRTHRQGVKSIRLRRQHRVFSTTDAGRDFATLNSTKDTLRLIKNYISLHKVLVPSEPSQNAALELWKLCKALPPQDRPQLLDCLSSKHIVMLWQLAATIEGATRQQRSLVLGPDQSLLDDFPLQPEDGTFVYEGKAALGVGFPLIDRFKKIFTVPRGSADEVIGRVDVNKGVLGNALYPLYFTVDIGESVVPATGELAAVALKYCGPDELGVDPADLPRGWPRPAEPRFPFDHLVDYLRPFGPGMYVGKGWKFPENDPLGRKFLTFIMIWSPSQSQKASSSPSP